MPSMVRAATSARSCSTRSPPARRPRPTPVSTTSPCPRACRACGFTSDAAKRRRAMAFTSWRGVVGCIKPTLRPGGLEELIRMLPEGIGVLPLFLNIHEGTTAEFKRAVAPYEPLVRELADAGCDLIHPEGAPPF